jgi:hypothetical protein
MFDVPIESLIPSFKRDGGSGSGSGSGGATTEGKGKGMTLTLITWRHRYIGWYGTSVYDFVNSPLLRSISIPYPVVTTHRELVRAFFSLLSRYYSIIMLIYLGMPTTNK